MLIQRICNGVSGRVTPSRIAATIVSAYKPFIRS
jgi:hypothetical protein